MSGDAGIPPKYNPMLVAQAMLEEAIELYPRCPTADDFSRRIIADPDDHREVGAASQAIRKLKQSGLFALSAAICV